MEKVVVVYVCVSEGEKQRETGREKIEKDKKEG